MTMTGHAAAARSPYRNRQSRTAAARTVQRDLNLYLDRIGKFLPTWFCRSVIWLRRPSRLLIRIAVSLLLVLGGLLSFLPVLGLWMLPFGLVILSQDLPFLQRPLLRSFQWIERRWPRRRPKTLNEAATTLPKH
jgi:hypothetical protein